MSNNDTVVVYGEIVENLPNTLFRVKLDLEKDRQGNKLTETNPDERSEKNDHILICYLSGKMRKNYIKILPGDKVMVELTPYDPSRGRIIYRK